jgi:hypothetical protein
METVNYGRNKFYDTGPGNATRDDEEKILQLMGSLLGQVVARAEILLLFEND